MKPERKHEWASCYDVTICVNCGQRWIATVDPRFSEPCPNSLNLIAKAEAAMANDPDLEAEVKK